MHTASKNSKVFTSISCIFIIPGDSELKRDHSRCAEEQIVTANPDLRTVCGISSVII